MAKVRTRSITITASDGTRLKKPKWGRARLWQKYPGIAKNLTPAIAHANKVLENSRIGTIVYVGDIPVYHCKWGSGKGFSGWKGNPVAGLWQRKLSA